MDYKETLDYMLEALPMYQRVGSSAYKATLDNAFKLDEHFDSPHRKFKTIHIGGTNGKGSVSHMIASVLQAAGYKTGLYTSPHLLDFRERIKINGEMISRDYVVSFIETNKVFFEDLNPSFFEMSVFMAFTYFASQEVNYAVIEVGLGGRLDTTNIISPELAVITNIGLDHTQFLGDSLKSIAIEKAGIIKSNCPVIVGETQEETKDIFIGIAENRNSDLTFADQIYQAKYSMKEVAGSVSWHFEQPILQNDNTLKTDLGGMYQAKNLATVLVAIKKLQQLGLSINTHDIKSGLSNTISNTGILGRWQTVGYNPLVICDIAHNQEGIKEVLDQLKNTPHRSLQIIIGFVADKNIESMLKILPAEANYYLVEPSIPRAMQLEKLGLLFKKFSLRHQTCCSIEEAYHKAQQQAGSNDIIFIGGSTFVVADFLAMKKKTNSF